MRATALAPGSTRPAMGRRRAFLPRDMRGCVMWLDANRGITLTSGKVSAWQDLSGAGNGATQSSAAVRPVMGGGLNGHATVSITGTQHLTHTLVVGAACTVAFVAKTDSAGAVYCAVATSAPNGIYVFARSGTNGDTWGLFQASDAIAGSSLATFKACVGVVRAYNDIDLRTNGASVTRATGSAAVNAGGGFIGSSLAGTQCLDGELAEIAMYSRTLSVPECLRIESYFKQKYGL
jgi:hypothetical protein